MYAVHMLYTCCTCMSSTGSKRCAVPGLDAISSFEDAARLAAQLRTARRHEAHARSMEAAVMRGAPSSMGAPHAAGGRAFGGQGASTSGGAGGGAGEEEEEDDEDDVTRFEEADPEEVRREKLAVTHVGNF